MKCCYANATLRNSHNDGAKPFAVKREIFPSHPTVSCGHKSSQSTLLQHARRDRNYEKAAAVERIAPVGADRN